MGIKKQKKNKEDNNSWTYIRIKKTTAKKLKLLKITRDDLMYENTLQYLLSKEIKKWKTQKKKYLKTQLKKKKQRR